MTLFDATFSVVASVATYATAILLPLGLVLVGYQLAIDPLRNFPGPFIARFTDAYGGYHALRKRLFLQTHADLQKYGPVYRQGPNRLVFNSLTALQDIYHHPRINKASIYRHSQLLGQENIFGTLDRQRRRQKRKVYGRILSDRALRVFEPTMRAEIDVFLRLLLSKAGAPVNMSPLCERLATDVSGQLAFGQSLDTQTKPDNQFMPRAMSSRLLLGNIYMAWPALASMSQLVVLLNKKKFDAFRVVLMGLIGARVALPKDAKQDFYSVAIEEPEYNDDNLHKLWVEATFIVPAGGMTTSGALSAAFFYLSRYPAAYARLATEIRASFPDGHSIQSGPILSSCAYLRAVIDETLRLSAPTTPSTWREEEPPTTSAEPFIVDGHVIPPGTFVAVSSYSLMHNEAYFPDPFTFQPERWLETEHGESAAAAAMTLMRRAFVAFGAGDSMCLGKGMAYLQIGLVLAKILWYFDFQAASGEAGMLGGGDPNGPDKLLRSHVNEYQLFDGIVADHDGPNLIFTPRDTVETIS